MRLLLVEDDLNLGKATQDGLRDRFAVDWVTSAEEAEDALLTTEYALVLLDVNLPGKSGLGFLEDIRKRKQSIPVLFLTARDAVHHRVEGLNAGADDYLVKPFDLDELMARCDALIRRGHSNVLPVIEYKDMCFEAHTGYLEKEGKPINLSAKEREIFHLLIRNMGRPISKEKIIESVYDWSTDQIDVNTIEAHIASLRRKLGSDIIKTMRGIGYIIEK